MPVEITVPQLGESIVEATVGRWLKNEGDAVSEGEAVVELETDKVNMEVPATAAGTLQSIVKTEGETVGIGDVLAVVAESGGAGSNSKSREAPPVASATVADATATPQFAAEEEEEEEGSNGSSRATPLARRMATEHGIDLAQIRGTGPSGRVRRDDVTAFLSTAPESTVETRAAAPAAPLRAPAAPQPAPEFAPLFGGAGRREERVKMSRRRQTIAQRLVEAQHSAAMLTTFNEIDMSAVMEVRRRRRDSFQERHGVRLGYMSFFTRAVVGALKSYPLLNAEIQGTEMVLKHYYDIGIAVGAEEGLVVPVVRDADRLSFADIEREIASLSEKARTRTLSLSELQGGTFTISNGGIYGSLMSTPILNAPQVGILGMHKIEQRPVVFNGEIVARPMMYVALSYDHRIVDGGVAVGFLVRVKELVEDPESLLLEG